jgi:iron complex outermembrane receptor protein
MDNSSNKARSLDDFYVQDFRMSYTWRNKIVKEADFIFQINNVFNRKYEPNGYTYSYIYGGNVITENFLFPMAGVNWLLGVNVRF